MKAKSGLMRPSAVAFDALGTLFDLQPLGNSLKEVGLQASLLGEWMARILRDGMALTAADTFAPFPEVARGTLEVLCAEHGATPKKEQLDALLKGFAELTACEGAVKALKRLKEAELRVAVLTNGSADSTRTSLEGAKLDGLVERVISIGEVKRWKPDRAVYLHATKVMEVEPGQLALVAAHAWDVQGANRAGLLTGWVSHKEKRFHPAMGRPGVEGETLEGVAARLLELPKG